MNERRARFKFASWNVNNRRLKDGHINLLRRADCDVLALQEVSSEFHRDLENLNIFDWAVSSLSLRPPDSSEGRARRLGCSLFGRSPFILESSELLNNLAFPERALIARVSSPSGALTLCSFHIPPGASWGKIKPETLTIIAGWLAMQEGTIVFGIDANAPKVDHPDPFANEWWWKDEPLLLGPTPVHHLCDAYRVLLKHRPAAMAAICAERPRGPLAVSHLRGRGDKKTACRYDFVYVTPDLLVEDLTYLHKEALEAGSDHALVVAHLMGQPLKMLVR